MRLYECCVESSTQSQMFRVCLIEILELIVANYTHLANIYTYEELTDYLPNQGY